MANGLSGCYNRVYRPCEFVIPKKIGEAYSNFSDILYDKVVHLLYKIENDVVVYSSVFGEYMILFL
jgi:hypothetical protein